MGAFAEAAEQFTVALSNVSVTCECNVQTGVKTGLQTGSITCNLVAEYDITRRHTV